MGDQRFICGRYKNRTFEEIAKNDADFCAAVLRSVICNKYYPEDFKAYLQSLSRPSICESKVTDFVSKWDANMKAEFRRIIGSPEIVSKQVHPPAAVSPNGDLGVFIRYFVKKCIFNVQASNATSYNVELFAQIFPFKVSKMVPPAELPVCKLFDAEFFSAIATFMVHHFEDKCDSAAGNTIVLFLRNIHHFRKQHFDENSMRRLKNVLDDAVDPKNVFFAATYANAYLKQFPRLSPAGVERYLLLRHMYNSLCTSFGCAELGDQLRRHVRMLPEINCYELLLLLEPGFYAMQKAKYITLFKKYLFFFVYAIGSPDNPVFFIDEPLYECLKGYSQYRSSREVPEDLELSIWLMTLVHRRTQPLDFGRPGDKFQVDQQNLQHIRNYVENFPGIESAVVDFVLPTSLMLLGMAIVTKDTVFRVFYTKHDKSVRADFYEGIIRALMCPLDIKKVTIYNACTGVETSVLVPAVKKEVLAFVRCYNRYDPARPIPVECNFTDHLEKYFEERTIQWDEKCARKSNPMPVYDYRDVFGDVCN